MGWSKRGDGRSYDSLNGQASIIGTQSGLIMGYTSKIRKCKKCDLGHNPKDHDCRRNYQGSAKGMEPIGAVDVTENNPFLRELNMELGVLVGDEDSSTILNVRNASDHEIIKHSDKNHVGKGVMNGLYKIQSKYKELTKEAITSLSRGFNYALAQNKGNKAKMKDAIENIPYHYFDDHKNCDTWCKYRETSNNNQEANNSSTNGVSKINSLKDRNLQKELKDFFGNLANNSDRFTACASSQSNESFNAIVASKAPKNRCYSLSESHDFRLACAVNQKNVGEKYIMNVAKKLQMSPGKNTKKYVKKVSQIHKKRSMKVKQRKFKQRRLFLKKQRTELRKKTESSEGITYQSNIGLLSDSPEQDVANQLLHKVRTSPVKPLDVVLFRIERSSLSKNADILSIKASYGDLTFSEYIKPTKKISEKVSEVSGLTSFEGNLLLHGKRIESVSLSKALRKLFIFLAKLDKKCVLATHNCSVDAPQLVTAIDQVGMSSDFEIIVHGFADTLSIVSKITGKKGKKENSIQELSNFLQIFNTKEICELSLLRQIIKKLEISNATIIKGSQSWQETFNGNFMQQEITNAAKSLLPLQQCTTSALRKKIATANITFEMIKDAYQENKHDGILRLFGIDENKNIRVTKSEKVVDKICQFLQHTM